MTQQKGHLMGTSKEIGVGVGGIALAIATLMGLSLGGLYWAGFLGKEAEKIRYDIHKESQSYRDGMQRELGRIKLEWDKADHTGRVGIEAHVRDTYSQTDTSEYPSHLKDFLSQIGVY